MYSTNQAKDCAARLRQADGALGRLLPHEELLLRLRFGIGGKRQSITVIATRFGLEPEDVRDLEARALMRLRAQALSRDARALVA